MKKKSIVIYVVLFTLITLLVSREYLIVFYLLLLATVKRFRMLLLNAYYNLVYLIGYLFSKKELRVYNKSDRREKIIVSLTTYNKRIKTVFLTIESIFEQEVKPDKIVLWLDKDEFAIDNLPKTLKKQIEQGLEIDFYHDIKSYKKLVPSLKKYANDIIITVDDDILYDKNCIKNLYELYLENKDSICCYYSFKFLNSNLLPTTNTEQAKYLFDYLGTGGGALFPPHVLPNDVFDEELFMRLSPVHDDVFISVLAHKYNIKLINVDEKNYRLYLKKIQKRTVLNTQSIGLFKENYFKNKTKTQLTDLLNYYDIKLLEIKESDN